ncbi:hypothetical protein [Pseudoalteromonas nigrifaciens]|uniref:hypothetical protein n=1 Tax=Pseudoalteromonas nigrifaciens TaxID=28109 RepID=UPI003FD54B2A
MTTKFYKSILIILAIIASNEALAGECKVISQFAPKQNNTLQICDEELDVLFGYDLIGKQPAWATYEVRATPFKGYVQNRGVYNDIPDVPEELQPDYSTGDNIDIGYLVAPYQMLKDGRYIENTFAKNNLLPISKNLWRGSLRNVLFTLDKFERGIVANKGRVTVVYGSIGGNNASPPKFLYRSYYQHRYGLSISFLVPVKHYDAANVEELITSVDCIEELADVDLFAHMPLPMQKDLENNKARNFSIWSRLDGLEGDVACDI